MIKCPWFNPQSLGGGVVWFFTGKGLRVLLSVRACIGPGFTINTKAQFSRLTGLQLFANATLYKGLEQLQILVSGGDLGANPLLKLGGDYTSSRLPDSSLTLRVQVVI